MKNKENPLRKISKFGSETMEELKKCTWPNKTELFESTIVVLISCFLLAGFVALVDWIFQLVIQGLIS